MPLIESMPAEMSPPRDAARGFVKRIFVYICLQTGPCINQHWVEKTSINFAFIPLIFH